MNKPSRIALCVLFLLICPALLSGQTVSERPEGKAFETHLSVDDSFDFANGLYSRRMYDMALPEFRNLIDQYPEDPRRPDAQFRMAESLFFLGRYEEAIAEYEGLLRLFPDYAQGGLARLHRGEALFKLGRSEEALNEMQAILTGADGELERAAHYYAGKLLLDQGDREAAKVHFEALINSTAEHPYREHVSYYLGQIALESNSLEDAEKYFSDNLESENAILRQLAFFGVARAAFQAGEFQQAAGKFREAFMISGNPDLREDAFVNWLRCLYNAGLFGQLPEVYRSEAAKVQSPEKKGDALYLVAHGQAREGHFDEAVTFYDELRALMGLSGGLIEKAVLGKAEALLSLKRPADALEVLATITSETAEDRERLLYLKGEALRRQDHYQEALDVFDDLIAEFPESGYREQIDLNRGYLYLDQGDTLKAREAFRSFLERYPENEAASKVLADAVLLGIQTESWDTAVVDSRDYLERFPDGKDKEKVLYRLASIYAETGENVEAEKTFQRYLEETDEATRDPDVYFFMGFNQQSAGHFKEAIADYQRVPLEKVSDSVRESILTNLGYCYVQIEDWDRAAGSYAELIQTYPDNQLGAEIYFWLADHYLKKGKQEVLRDLMSELQASGKEVIATDQLHYYLGESYRLEDRFEEAITHYEQALEGESAFRANILVGLGVSYKGLEEYPAAAEQLEKAVKLAGQDFALAVRARMELAESYEAYSDFPAAAKAYFSVAILYEDPKWVPIGLYRAGKAFRRGDDEKSARQAYEELIERYSGHPLAGKARAALAEMDA